MAGGPSPGSFKEPVPGSLSYRSWGTALEGQEASCGGGRTSCRPQEPARKAWEWGMSLGEGELMAQSLQRSFCAGSIRPLTIGTDDSVWTAPSNKLADAPTPHPFVFLLGENQG